LLKRGIEVPPKGKASLEVKSLREEEEEEGRGEEEEEQRGIEESL